MLAHRSSSIIVLSSLLCIIAGDCISGLQLLTRKYVSTNIFLFVSHFRPSPSTLKAIQKYYNDYQHSLESILENVNRHFMDSKLTSRGVPVFCCVIWPHIFPIAFHCLPCWQVIWNKEKIYPEPKHILEFISHFRQPEAVPIMSQNNQSIQKENLPISSFAIRYLTINLIQ